MTTMIHSDEFWRGFVFAPVAMLIAFYLVFVIFSLKMFLWGPTPLDNRNGLGLTVLFGSLLGLCLWLSYHLWSGF